MPDLKLRECPFCGGEAFVFKTIETPLPIMYAVVCKACYAGTNHKTKEIQAIEAWNNRIGEEDKHENYT